MEKLKLIKIKNCPRCGCKKIQYLSTENGTRFGCTECGFDVISKSINISYNTCCMAWNKRVSLYKKLHPKKLKKK